MQVTHVTFFVLSTVACLHATETFDFGYSTLSAVVRYGDFVTDTIGDTNVQFTALAMNCIVGFLTASNGKRYYGKRFTDCESLVRMIEDYIAYYNARRLQRNLGILALLESTNSFILQHKKAASVKH